MLTNNSFNETKPQTLPLRENNHDSNIKANHQCSEIKESAGSILKLESGK